MVGCFNRNDFSFHFWLCSNFYNFFFWFCSNACCFTFRYTSIRVYNVRCCFNNFSVFTFCFCCLLTFWSCWICFVTYWFFNWCFYHFWFSTYFNDFWHHFSFSNNRYSISYFPSNFINKFWSCCYYRTFRTVVYNCVRSYIFSWVWFVSCCYWDCLCDNCIFCSVFLMSYCIRCWCNFSSIRIYSMRCCCFINVISIFTITYNIIRFNKECNISFNRSWHINFHTIFGIKSCTSCWRFHNRFIASYFTWFTKLCFT